MSVPPSFPGQPLPSHISYEAANACWTASGSPTVRASSAASASVPLDHAVEVAVALEGELEADSEAVQRRAPRSDSTHSVRRRARPTQLVAVLVGLERDVVAEPLGLLVCVRVAADVDQQRGVVHDESVVVVEALSFGQSQGDDALPQHMLHRLPEAEVDPERERSDQFCQPWPWWSGVARGCHDSAR